MTIHELLPRLKNPKGSGTQCTARCPAHDDQSASLSVGVGRDGRILLRCHAGCRAESIVNAMGLTMKDLMPEKPPQGERWELIATYSYKDEHGKTLYRKKRYRKPDGTKTFVYQHPDGQGGWAKGKGNCEHVLYNLPALVKGSTVFLCEGEKDADTLIRQGLCATTSPLGADKNGGKWLDSFTGWFRDKTVLILQDNDEAGKRFAQTEAAAIRTAASCVKILDLTKVYPDLPPKGDISDLAERVGVKEAVRLLADLAKITPDWKPSAMSGTQEPAAPTPQASVRPSDFSDVGNAEIFEREYGSAAIWTKGGGWFVWDGKRWEQSDQSAVHLARKLSGRMLAESLDAYVAAQKATLALNNSLADPSAIDEEAADRLKKELTNAKAYHAHANATRRKNRLDAILSLAQAGLCRQLSVFDPNPLDLNTPAGIVNLATGAIRPHSPDALCSKLTKAAPGDAGREMWQDFLRSITEDDGSLTGFLQMVAGMSLIGKVYHEGIILAHGGGRNGKSTFFNALADVLGDYAGHIAVNTLTTERTNKGATLATLRGKRMILTGELEEHQRLSVAMLKALASTDILVAEEKFRAPESFKQTHSLFLFTNHLPRVGSTDGGTWRRLTVVPFTAVIRADKSVQNYGEVLAEKAAPAILQWAIEGAALFVRNGYKLTTPERVAIATEEYRAREDWIANFIADCCVKGGRVPSGELYKAYKAWSEQSSEFVRRSSDFVAAIEAAGYKKLESNGRKYWLGLNLDKAQTLGAQGFH